jgi:hypothetical protein
MTTERTKDWLILNAIECWLFNFPNHKWASEYIGLKEQIQMLSAAQTSPHSPKEAPAKPKVTPKKPKPAEKVE